MKYEEYLKSEVPERLAPTDLEGSGETSLLKEDERRDSSIVFATSRSFRAEQDRAVSITFVYQMNTFIRPHIE